MGEVRGNQVQVPAPEIRSSASERGIEAFGQGLAAGREWARKATQRTLDWIEGHPGEALLIAVGAGFVVGQLFFRRRRPVEEQAQD
jgi:ElaB/YqjD/DUF883 family membrane-anchored ribosome-binding protein